MLSEFMDVLLGLYFLAALDDLSRGGIVQMQDGTACRGLSASRLAHES